MGWVWGVNCEGRFMKQVEVTMEDHNRTVRKKCHENNFRGAPKAGRKGFLHSLT